MSGTGRGVRIAVIDSGIFPGHPHIGRLAGAVAIPADGVAVEGPAAAIDRLGHGTAVMAAIQEKAPDADYFAVRIFGEALRTRATTLVRAIDWCAQRGMDLINLSLGTTNEAHRDSLATAADRARAAGCLLIAPRETEDGLPSFPGVLPDVLGVGLDWDCPRDSYRLSWQGDVPRLAASGYPRPVPGVPPARNLHGISFAVANMTGLAARACEQVGVAGVMALLAREAAAA